MIDPLPGDIFNRGQVLNNTYEIEGVLGRGGTGEAYRARNLVSGRIVAIKALNSQFSGREDYVELMKREEEMRDIVHDAVVRYTECSRSDDGHVFLVMDFIDGPSMHAMMERSGIDQRDLLIIAHRVTEGLVAAHNQGIVHRDLSPDNVILRDGRPERATIIDFGIAKDTSAGARTIVGNDFAGKYEYAAPEQIDGRAEPRSDLYSLGALLLAAFRGELPFAGATPGEIIRRKQRPLETDGVPGPLKGIIDWFSAPEPDQRPADARAALARLEELLLPQNDRTPTTKARGRSRLVWLAVPVLAALGVLGAWSAGLFGPPAPPPLPIAAPYRLSAASTADSATLTGNAPTPEAAALIDRAFAKATGTAPPDGALTLADGVPSEAWASGVAAVIAELGELEDWTLDVRDVAATLSGTAPDRDARERIQGLLRQAAAVAGIDVTSALRAGPMHLSIERVGEIIRPLEDCGPLVPIGTNAETYRLGETVAIAGTIAMPETAGAVKAAVEAVAGDRPVRVDATVLNPPICMIHEILAELPQDGLSIWLGQGATGETNATGIFRPGDNPLAELRLPADRKDGYLWVAVVDTTGNVFNLLPNLSLPEHRVGNVGSVEGSMRRVRLLHTLDEFAADNTRLAMRVSDGDFGKSEILAFLSRTPLFELRPKTETAASFAKALSEAIAADAGNLVAVASRVVDSRP